MAREILILRRLDHPNVVKLQGLVTSRMSCSLYLVFDYMEHDLAGLASSPGIKFTEPQVGSSHIRFISSFSLSLMQFHTVLLIQLQTFSSFASSVWYNRSNATCISYYLASNTATTAMCCTVISRDQISLLTMEGFLR